MKHEDNEAYCWELDEEDSNNKWPPHITQMYQSRNIKGLIQALRSEDEDPYVVSSALISIGRPATKYLLKLLEDDNPNVRKKSAFILGFIGGKKTITALTKSLKDPDEFVRWNTLYALTNLLFTMNCEEEVKKIATEPIIDLLKDELEYVRAEALMLLGAIGGPKVVEPIIMMLKDENKLIRRQATYYLGKIADERAVEPLIQALDDKDYSVQINAILSLVNLWKAGYISLETAFYIYEKVKFLTFSENFFPHPLNITSEKLDNIEKKLKDLLKEF